MSRRNIRKLYGVNPLPPLEGNSDEEFSPLYTKTSPSKCKYAGLDISSNSESGCEAAHNVEILSPEVATKKKKKKKKKQKQTNSSTSSTMKNQEEMDEIDKCVLEVNALLGSPLPIVATKSTQSSSYSEADLMAVEQKHLSCSNELIRKFGHEEPENKKRGLRRDQYRLSKKAVIIPITEQSLSFPKFGISVSVEVRENGLKYFTFDHNKTYQECQKKFLRMSPSDDSYLEMLFELSEKNMLVDGLLASADVLFRMEEYHRAEKRVTQVISYMQYVAEPSFNITNSKVRLEYKYLENRPFHIAVLKYLYLLTNRACHRTALELAKLLLNLDPTDPLAVMFIIDTLALRAREHQWFSDLIFAKYGAAPNEFPFNIEYSFALVEFHVASKNKSSLIEADLAIQSALMSFPDVFQKIMECGSISCARLKSHELFQPNPEDSILHKLMLLYVTFTLSWWRERDVLQWLLKNANELADKYDNDANFREHLKKSVKTGFSKYIISKEVLRHLCVIKPMASLLVDDINVPYVRDTKTWNPVPPENGVDRYGYNQMTIPTLTASPATLVNEFFRAILPNYNLPPPFETGPEENERENAANEAADNNMLDEQSDDAGTLNFVASTIGALTNAVQQFTNGTEASGGNPEPAQPAEDQNPEDGQNQNQSI